MSVKLIPKSARAKARSEVLRAWARALKRSGMTVLDVSSKKSGIEISLLL